MPLFDIDKGINDAGVFRIICRDCDSKTFRDYEEPKNYSGSISPTMIAQIAMKNYLYNISKRLFEIEFDEIFSEAYPMYNNVIINQSSVNRLDLAEYKVGFEKAKRLACKNWDDEYYMFFCETLNYVVPMAFQNSIALISDFEKGAINNVHSMSSEYSMQYLHICVFPFDKTSIVLLFIDAKQRRYRNFIKQFNKLSFFEKLSAVNYIIFAYSEDVFLSKCLDNEIFNNSSLVETSKKTSLLSSKENFEGIDISKSLLDNFDLSFRNQIPNLLSEGYRLCKNKER